MNRIAVVGMAGHTAFLAVERLPEPGETAKAFSVHFEPGGKGFNQALAFSRAGSRVSFAGRYGENDAYLMDLLKDSGVDTSLSLISRTETGKAIVTVSKDGENSIIVYRGANGDIPREYIERVLSRFHRGDLLILQNEIANLGGIIKLASEKKLITVLNPSPADENVKEEYFDIIDYRKVFYI